MAGCLSTRRSCSPASHRLRFRSASRRPPCWPAAPTRPGSHTPGALHSSPGGCRAPGCCWACGGRITFSAGAAIPPATRAKTPRCCHVSREGASALLDLLLIGVIPVVFWGTVLPLLSGRAGQGRGAGAAYYDRAAGRVFVATLLLMAARPLVAWRHAGGPLWRSLRWPD